MEVENVLHRLIDVGGGEGERWLAILPTEVLSDAGGTGLEEKIQSSILGVSSLCLG